MMREILFRGKFGNEWKYGFLSIEPKGLVIKEPTRTKAQMCGILTLTQSDSTQA